MRRGRPVETGRHHQASLEVRHTEFLAVWPWWVGAAFVWTVLPVIATRFLPNLQDWIKLPPVLFMVGSLFFTLFGLLVCRLLAQEPEPYSEFGTGFLEEEYMRFRRARTLRACVLLLSSALLFEVLALILLVSTNWTLVAWLGAWGGCVVGTLGGVVGVWSSFRRAALNRIVIEYQTT